MRISPVPELLVLTQIFPPHIEASDESDPSVYHHDLPVIAVIHTQLQLPQKRREELGNLDPRFLHPRPVRTAHASAAHAVEQDTDLHALPRFTRQDLFNLLPEFVISYNIILHMDIIPCMVHL